MSKRDWWRCYPEFKERTIFVDIETDPEKITVIGIYDGKRMNNFIRGKNLVYALPLLKKASLIVTYNGTGFDLPVIRNEMNVNVEAIHIDLMYLLRRLGLKGGLKKIEKVIGIRREKEIDGLSGKDAVELWHEYKSGNYSALSTLIKYNRADVVNLELLLKLCYKKMRMQTFVVES
ncbi:MAG: ribonuclease H-like domain-containing protein [Candidatus Thermoplasmatota archaeon]